MFINIEDKELIVKYLDEYIKLPNEIQKKIDLEWERIIEDNPTLWDGNISCVYDVKINCNHIEVMCMKSKYSHYLYQERIGLPKEYECRNISAGSLLETSDGYFILCELDSNTSYPTVLQIPGGNIDKKDINNGEIDCLKTIIRETKEEVNIDLNDKSFVKEYKINGFYNADDGIQPGTQVFAIVKLNMNKAEMENHFKNYYEWLLNNKGELEIKKLHFLHKNNCLEEFENLNNPKRAYIRPLLEHNIITYEESL